MSEDVVGANIVTRRAYITQERADFGGWGLRGIDKALVAITEDHIADLRPRNNAALLAQAGLPSTVFLGSQTSRNSWDLATIARQRGDRRRSPSGAAGGLDAAENPHTRGDLEI